jgi:nonribosomal peptide synthetase MxcG
MNETLDLATARRDIANLLYLSPDELDDELDLFTAGLDSVRVLSLVGIWRERGIEISFIELAERPTLGGWFALLATRIPGKPYA